MSILSFIVRYVSSSPPKDLTAVDIRRAVRQFRKSVNITEYTTGIAHSCKVVVTRVPFDPILPNAFRDEEKAKYEQNMVAYKGAEMYEFPECRVCKDPKNHKIDWLKIS